MTESAFVIYGEVYTYFHDYVRLYDSLPDRKDLESIFSHLELEMADPGELAYYIDEMRKLEVSRKAQSAIMQRFGMEGRI